MINYFQGLSESFGFIIFFLIGTLFFTMIFGEQVTVWYLALVLIGMLIVNVNKVEEIMGRYSTP